jgi:hypothetical protein
MEDQIMRTSTKALLAVCAMGGAAAVAFTGSPAKAQAFYIDAPGIHVGVGERHHRYYRRYHRGYGAYAADPGHPYGYNHDYGDARCRVPNYMIQDGVCKPYRGY